MLYLLYFYIKIFVYLLSHFSVHAVDPYNLHGFAEHSVVFLSVQQLPYWYPEISNSVALNLNDPVLNPPLSSVWVLPLRVTKPYWKTVFRLYLRKYWLLCENTYHQNERAWNSLQSGISHFSSRINTYWDNRPLYRLQESP